ncbi:MobA/MobL family protein [Dyella sp.]|uniref:MobA/MobL family protein n=1 Tax=Dyella sp. TaxID=1869338 RepID=UPI002844899E|nr:MobA/MobL family protein [Dyella sp.]MDR3445401.1 MobA/MobL family protein [Dyella sp.]
MHQHARPHLETHARSKNHSSVAGAAYRLGLRLFDERLGVWHDFRKRALGEEIVRALTVAPNGSPVWATDPAQLWNRVEASERRKDAQIARDYRIPIPFGLTDHDAGNLAEEMARFISDTLHVPVSLGLHRDADRDALGEVKPKEKQGFHAHLYFPTRRLEEQAEEGGSGTGFGSKLTVLSNKNTSAAFVEMLNCKWSELATDYARKSGSDLSYQYKSYKRLGINIQPQPTLGQSATAMERRGIYTNKGDSLREAMVMAQVYEEAHAGALKAQHAQALQDVKREHGNKPHRHFGLLATSTRIGSQGSKRPTSAPPLITPRGSLAYRLRTSAPTPTTKEEVEALERSLVLIEALDKAFAVYHQLQNEMDELFKIIESSRAASLDAHFQVDQSRQRGTVAQVRLRRWEDENRWRIKFLASVGGMPMATHEKLRKNVQLHDGHVQALKATMVTHAIDVAEMEQKVEGLKATQSEVLSTIRNKACALDDAKSKLMPELLKALPSADRSILQAQLPTLLSDVEDGVDRDCRSRNATAAVMSGSTKTRLKKESTSAESHEVPEGPTRGHSKHSF